MEEIAKAFLGMFFTMLVAFLGVSTISASMDARNANALMAECSSRIAASDYSDAVIKECQEMVKNKTSKHVADNASQADKNAAKEWNDKYAWSLEIPESSKIKDESGRTVYCKGKLNYYYSISFINLFQKHTIEADIK